GQQVEEGDADGDRDDDVEEEGGRRAHPYEGRAAARRGDQGGEHGLVRKRADEDDRKDGEDDGEIQGDLSVWAERSLRERAPHGRSAARSEGPGVATGIDRA